MTEREKWEYLILKHWDIASVPYYLSEILSGEATVESTKEDLLSFEKEK